MKPFNLDWASITVVNAIPRDNTRVVDVIARFNRMGLGRTKDPTFEMEREFLDAADEKVFIHRIFEVKIHRIPTHIYIEFTPTEIILGQSIEY